MRSKEITVTVKRTIQTESYESSSVEITETFVLDDADDEAECRHAAYATVTKTVKKAIDNEFRKYMRSASERKQEKKEAGI